MWFALAILGYAFGAVVVVLDKLIVSKKSVSPLVYTFYSSVFLIPLFLFLPFGVVWLSGWYWLWALVAAVTFVFGLWAAYAAFQKSEVSHAGPLIGAAIPVFILLINAFSLGESFSQKEMLGIILLIFGCFIISSEKSSEHEGWHIGFFWAIISALFFAISNVASKYVYNEYGFYSGIIWTRLMIGFSSLFILFSKKTRKEMFGQNKKVKKESTDSGKWFLIVTDKILSVVSTVLVQYAIAIGSVVIVNALLGVQYALLIIMIAFLSKFFPKIFREEYSDKEIIQEAIAVGAIASGLFFLF